VEIIPGEIREGAALMFYPEVNAIIRVPVDPRSGTPAFKRAPVLVRSGLRPEAAPPAVSAGAGAG
jgi:hypothetical protein